MMGFRMTPDGKTRSKASQEPPQLERRLGLLDSTMIVSGSMIGTGIFIVAAEMSRQIGSTGWLLASWVITGLLTVSAALSSPSDTALSNRRKYVLIREV